MERKIVFFDIDGTLITEHTHRLPASAVQAVRKARENGHLMFINTGRTRCSIDPRLDALGFDGFVCGCGTDVFIGEKELFHREFSHEKGQRIVELSRECRIDILLEAKEGVYFDWDYMTSRPCREQYGRFRDRGLMPQNWEIAADRPFDKFVTWTRPDSDLPRFIESLSPDFAYIDRGQLSEFVPAGYTKATGLQAVLDYYGLPLSAAYAIGDGNNDRPMLDYVPGSIAMGNCRPASLRDCVSFVTKDIEEDGIQYALQHIGVL